MTLKFDDDLEKKTRIPLLYYIKLCTSFQSHLWSLTGVTVRKCSIRVKIGDFLSHVTLKFDGWPWRTIGHLLYYVKLCASFQSHHWIPTGVTVRKHSIRAEIFFFSSRVTIKFDGRPWKTIGHLFYTTPSLEHYFKAIGDFKLELQSRNIQFGSKSISLTVWPWNLTDDLEKQQGTSPKTHQALCIILSPYVNSNRSNSLETAKLGFDLCDFDL